MTLRWSPLASSSGSSRGSSGQGSGCGPTPCAATSAISSSLFSPPTTRDRTAVPAASRSETALLNPFSEMDGHVVTLALVEDSAQVRLDRQLVRSVAERHEGAAKGVAVDGSGDLDQAARAEEFSTPVGHDVGPSALRRALLQGGGEGLVERHSNSSVMWQRLRTVRRSVMMVRGIVDPPFSSALAVHERAWRGEDLARFQPGLEAGQDHWPSAVQLGWGRVAELVVSHRQPARVTNGFDLPRHPRRGLAFGFLAP